MLTTIPAQALGQGKTLGILQTDFWADWVGWRIPLEQDPFTSILQSTEPAEMNCISGKITPHEKI
jgi:imidazolonepropionase-like amidohydrolase